MSLMLPVKKSQDTVGKCSPCLAILLSLFFCSILLSGCESAEQDENSDKVIDAKSSKLNLTENSANLDALTVKEPGEETVYFAPTVNTERRGFWQGGAPPINKRASGIDTYFRIKAIGIPNQLKVTLRFEGVNSDDAKVSFKAIDGAKFKSPSQQTQWRLQPNIASELSFIIITPDNVSYLSLNTFQNNKGASRAFLLEIPRKQK